MNNYTLDVVSDLPEFSNKSFKKFNVDGLDHIGVYGNEPFTIKFHNNTWERVQVRLSLDGTCILTGKLADTDPKSDGMFMVEPNRQLILQAWPESNRGGSKFVFTSGDKGVAKNLHGNMSSNGIIAAAVFTEGDRSYKYPQGILRSQSGGWNMSKGLSNTRYSSGALSSSTMDSMITANDSSLSDNLRSLASVGKGEEVKQELREVSGLIQPVFSQALKIKYVWWDDLVAKLRVSDEKFLEMQSLGFPGNIEKKFINLDKVPKTDTPIKYSSGFERFI